MYGLRFPKVALPTDLASFGKVSSHQVVYSVQITHYIQYICTIQDTTHYVEERPAKVKVRTNCVLHTCIAY